MQQIFLGLGAVAEKTYVDDVFSPFLYEGTGSAKTVTTGIDQSGEGSLTWIKKRDSAVSNHLYDTVRGAGKGLSSDLSSAEYNLNTRLSGFTSTGFTLGNNGAVNANGGEYSSWNFRKAPGFFDVVTWTGNNTNRTIAHNLKCVPGCIMVKRTDDSYDWRVFHVGNADNNNAAHYFLELNNTDAKGDNSNRWQDTLPTSTHFSIGDNSGVNYPGGSYVAYVFAGGESTAATARSVDFDANTESLYATSSDYAFGTGDFTVEAWIKPSNVSGISYQNILDTRGSVGDSTTGFSFGFNANGELYMYSSGFDITSAANTIANNQWYHIALVNNGGTIKAYVNGVEKGSFSNNRNFTNTTFRIANATSSSGQNFVGSISNVRVVKGTAVYTSSFRPPTEPLTNITNTKLLCCNNSSTTGSTVASGTLTADGSPTASTDSPFDDPAAFKFGDSKEGIIKCGSYKGSGSAGLEVNVGWEPSWLMLKVTSRTGDWYIMDSMRGVVTSGNDEYLKANETDAEGSADVIEFTSTGFKVISTGTHWNNSAETYLFTVIRRADGYVGKPIELGTDAFTMDWGNSTSQNSWTSGFPVDYAIYRRTHYVTDWFTSARLMQGKELIQNTTAAESAWTGAAFDSNTAWGANSGMDSSYLSYMWKRHKGFDVQRYTGKTGQQSREHGLSVVPEMIWVKSTNNAYEWAIGHKDLTSGWTSKHLRFTNSGEITGQQFALAPTATHWTTPNGGLVNDNGEEYIAMLFSSITGVSAVGSYTGSGGVRWINVGFQPRFLLIKITDGTGDWLLVDSMRGVDKNLYLNTTAANSGGQQIQTNSTSFAITALGANEYNVNNEEYIYYCHA